MNQVFWNIRAQARMVLTVTTRQCEPDITVIELGGRVTLGRESGQIETAVLRAIEAGARKLVIDLGKVSYIDSTGIGIVAFCFSKISRAGGEVRISGARDLVLDVFRITRLDSIIKFFPDAESACASLRPARQPA